MDGPSQHRVWEDIAASFSDSRRRTWPHVTAYLDALPPNSHVLDLMCGNGRHTAPALAAGHRVTASDWSRPLLGIVRERYPAAVVVAADATRLPFADAAFDACTYVAGLHGIPDAAGRAASLAELHRVLRPGATAQITVWGRDAPRFRDQGEPGEPIDVVIPWRSGGHDADRTYHLYTPASLRLACEAAGFRVVAEEAVAVVSRDGPDNHVITVAA